MQRWHRTLFICVACSMFSIGSLEALRLGKLKRTESIRPYGLRRTFEKGLGDRYYRGLPAYKYEHFWPEWKRTILNRQHLYNKKQMPEWVPYYDYQFIVHPMYYYYHGIPKYDNVTPKYTDSL